MFADIYLKYDWLCLNLVWYALVTWYRAQGYLIDLFIKKLYWNLNATNSLIPINILLLVKRNRKISPMYHAHVWQSIYRANKVI